LENVSEHGFFPDVCVIFLTAKYPESLQCSAVCWLVIHGQC